MFVSVAARIVKWFERVCFKARRGVVLFRELRHVKKIFIVMMMMMIIPKQNTFSFPFNKKNFKNKSALQRTGCKKHVDKSNFNIIIIIILMTPTPRPPPSMESRQLNCTRCALTNRVTQVTCSSGLCVQGMGINYHDRNLVVSLDAGVLAGPARGRRGARAWCGAVPGPHLCVQLHPDRHLDQGHVASGQCWPHLTVVMVVVVVVLVIAAAAAAAVYHWRELPQTSRQT